MDGHLPTEDALDGDLVEKTKWKTIGLIILTNSRSMN